MGNHSLYLKALIWLLTISYASVFVSAKETIIKGHIRNYQFDKMYAGYYDSQINWILQKQTIDSTVISTDGSFEIKMDINAPVEFYLKNGRRWVFGNKYLEPGDSVELEINAQSGGGYFMDIAANWSDANMFLHYFSEEFDIDRAKRQEFEKSFSLPQDEFREYIDLRREKMLAMLEKKRREMNLSSDFLKFIRAEIDYRWVMNLSQYPAKYRDADLKNNFPVLDSNFFDFIYEIDFNNPDPESNIRFVMMAMSYMYQKQFIDRLEKIKNSRDVSPAKRYYFLLERYANIFKGKAYDIVGAMIVRDQINETLRIKPSREIMYKAKAKSMFKHAGLVIEQYAKKCNDKEKYLKPLEAMYEKMKRLVPGSDVPDDIVLKDSEGNEFTLKDLKGKVLYLNFWSTNCRYCVESIPYLKVLHDSYIADDLEIISIAFEPDAGKVKKYLEERELGDIRVVVVHEGLKSEIAKYFSLTGIPRYVLIDRYSQIYSSNAPSPKDVSAGVMIKRLLGE